MVEEVKDGAEAGGTTTVEAGMESHAETAESLSPDATELVQLRGERDQLIDRLARLQAEFDNAAQMSE